AGTPKPMACVPSRTSSRTSASRVSTSASCELVGVGRSTVPWMWPPSSTTPARIFVPPRSTPITCLPAMPPGTLLRRDGGGRQALPRLQGRTHQGEGARAEGPFAVTARRRVRVSRARRAPARRPVRVPQAHPLGLLAADRVRGPARDLPRVGGRELFLG